MASIFLYAPQDFHNLCLMVRTLEAFGHNQCLVFDPHGIVRERYGKVRSREMRAVSAGAFQKISWVRIERPEALLMEHRGRIIATVAQANATSLYAHRFEHDDLVVFGSESAGLPAALMADCDVVVTIPLVGATQSLNLAVSVGIVLFELERQQQASAR